MCDLVDGRLPQLAPKFRLNNTLPTGKSMMLQIRAEQNCVVAKVNMDYDGLHIGLKIWSVIDWARTCCWTFRRQI